MNKVSTTQDTRARVNGKAIMFKAITKGNQIRRISEQITIQMGDHLCLNSFPIFRTVTWSSKKTKCLTATFQTLLQSGTQQRYLSLQFTCRNKGQILSWWLHRRNRSRIMSSANTELRLTKIKIVEWTRLKSNTIRLTTNTIFIKAHPIIEAQDRVSQPLFKTCAALFVHLNFPQPSTSSDAEDAWITSVKLQTVTQIIHHTLQMQSPPGQKTSSKYATPASPCSRIK